MLMARRALIIFCVLAAAIFAWLWWARPVKVDMAAYVPADSIIYFEADSLPEIFGAVASTCFFVTGWKYRLRRLRSS